MTNVVYAQTPANHLKSIIGNINTQAKELYLEKLYLQTDKYVYTAGDTLWFKAYLVDAASLTNAVNSNILYVELVNDTNLVITRMMLPLYKGLALGNITLHDSEIPQGGYILRAYTNWMRNFGEDYMFKKRLYISNSTDQDWMVNYNSRTVKDDGKENVLLNLHINELNNNPVRVREMQLQLTDGKRTWFKSDAQTDLDGNIKVNFNLPEKANAKNLTLSLQDLRKGQGNRKLPVPVLLNRIQNTDLQFMPEGGHLVAEINARVAIKAINENGLAANVSGTVYNSKNQPVVTFKTEHKGMGVFSFTPAGREVYYAIINTDSTLKHYPLPLVKLAGMVLQVNNPLKGDSCYAIISSSPGMVGAGNQYYLMGLARGAACYGASFKLTGQTAVLKIGKQAFPSGVTRFVLIDAAKNILNERLVYFDHGDNLKINVSPDKPTYRQRDSVALNIAVTDFKGNPVQGSFSLAVTDDAQTKIDSLVNGSIITQLLLTSNLKGNIEDPGYYTNAGTSAAKWQHLNILLLAQGWVGYDWANAFKPLPKYAFEAEQEFTIKGKVTNVFNKPVAKSGITLFSKKPLLVTDTVTNERGEFLFKGIFPTDTAAFFIQAKNKRGKSFNVGIEVNEFTPPVFNPLSDRAMPWYVNIDTGRALLVRRQLQLKNEHDRIITNGTRLRAVEVKAKKIIKGSKNLNGAGEADVIIDEEQLGKLGRTTLGDLLEKKVKGFVLKTGKGGVRSYVIQGLLMHLIIDGISVDFFYDPNASGPLDVYYKQFMDYYDAQDIKGIEVMTSGKYQLYYSSQYLEPLDPWVKFFDHAFVEVTTRSGHGPFMRKAVGTYLYKPMPFQFPKSFYAPKYKAGSLPNMTDIRSTIHWEPNIITDKNGRATVSFYTSDNAGKYSVVIEGCDMDGSVGARRGKITVEKVAN